MESIKIKNISQWVEDDATLRFSVGSVSFGILPDVTLGGVRVAVLDAKNVEKKNY